MSSQSNTTASISPQPAAAAAHIPDGAVPQATSISDAMAAGAMATCAMPPQLPTLDAASPVSSFESTSSTTMSCAAAGTLKASPFKFLNDISIRSTGEIRCRLCSKRLANRSNLRRHLRCCHSPSRPFVCCCCSKEFSDSSNCKKHQATCARARGKLKVSESPTGTESGKPVAKHPRRQYCKFAICFFIDTIACSSPMIYYRIIIIL